MMKQACTYVFCDPYNDALQYVDESIETDKICFPDINFDDSDDSVPIPDVEREYLKTAASYKTLVYFVTILIFAVVFIFMYTYSTPVYEVIMVFLWYGKLWKNVLTTRDNQREAIQKLYKQFSGLSFPVQ